MLSSAINHMVDICFLCFSDGKFMLFHKEDELAETAQWDGKAIEVTEKEFFSVSFHFKQNFNPKISTLTFQLKKHLNPNISTQRNIPTKTTFQPKQYFHSNNISTQISEVFFENRATIFSTISDNKRMVVAVVNWKQ